MRALLHEFAGLFSLFVIALAACEPPQESIGFVVGLRHCPPTHFWAKAAHEIHQDFNIPVHH